jgi:hypothetical protein
MSPASPRARAPEEAAPKAKTALAAAARECAEPAAMAVTARREGTCRKAYAKSWGGGGGWK